MHYICMTAFSKEKKKGKKKRSRVVSKLPCGVVCRKKKGGFQSAIWKVVPIHRPYRKKKRGRGKSDNCRATHILS